MNPLTIGEFRVGISFNPSGRRDVEEIKSMAANFIDYIDRMPKSEDPAVASEQGRLKALAMTHIEDAAMWAVKAATKGA